MADHIFISYSRKDRAYARKLAGHLRGEGFAVWIDDRIDYGERWPHAIREAVRSCAAFIVLMTPAAEESVWVGRETTEAESRSKPIFPLLRAGEPFFRLNEIQYVDVTDGQMPGPDLTERLVRGGIPRRRHEPAPSIPTRGRSVSPSTGSTARKKWPRWTWAVGGLLVLLLTVGGILLDRGLGERRERLQAGVTRVRETDGAVMVYLPAGEFWMGSAEDDPDAFDSEKPRHRVSVEAFWIDRTEVTNAQYRKCVDAGACSPPQELSSRTRERYYGDPVYDDYPVIHVTWHQARAYAEWAGGRLPTEAEWAYAARGPEGATYPWGTVPPNERLLNYNWTVGDTTEAGAYPEGASWVGALDMAGNVWEWTSSLYVGYRYPYDPDDGREDPAAEGARVVRGGAFGNHAQNVRCAYRLAKAPDDWDRGLGFRVVLASPD